MREQVGIIPAMAHTHNDDVDEYRQDALGPILAIIGVGWAVTLVGNLVGREAFGTAWHPWPLAAVFGALLVAQALRMQQPQAAAWALTGGLLAGSALLTLSAHGQAALVLFLLPIVVAHVLLPAPATWSVALLAVMCMGLATTFGQPDPSLSTLARAGGMSLVPALICLLTAACLSFNALNIEALVRWAMDSQRKDARRAELFRRQQEQLRQVLHALELANGRLHRVNGELAEARRVAETANQLKTRFLANVSHELRAPLQVILGLAEAALAVPGAEDTALQRDLVHIQHSSRHLRRLIDDLLDLSRAEINALELHPETVEPRALLSELFQSMHDSQEERACPIWRLDLPERLPLLQADPLRLRQILFNLLSNAAKYTPQGTITLGAAGEPPYLHLWVADTGSGIPLAQQEQIFEPFVSDPTRRRPEGVGLGLSITRHLVSLHHGLITLESQPGVGSTFHIYLPLPNLQGQPARPLDVDRPVAVLLSDRDEPAPEILTMARRQGLPLRRPHDVAELAHLLNEEQPVTVIWDLSDTVTAHWPLLQHLRADPRLASLPLMLFAQGEGPVPDLAAGVTEVLLKPIGDTALAARVQAVGATVADSPILIVDDDPHARASYRAILGHALPQRPVIEAADGAAAIDLLAHERPGLIILDLMMPEVDGFAVLEEVRANPATRPIPVLVLSGRVLSLEDVERLRHSDVTFQSKETLANDELATEAERVMIGENALSPATSALVKRAIAYVHQHYEHPFSRQEIAAFVGVSERYLTEIVHQELGLSLWEYLNRFRMAQARALLRSTDLSIGEVAARVGIENSHYFARIFRRQSGLSPTAYRERPAEALTPISETAST